MKPLTMTGVEFNDQCTCDMCTTPTGAVHIEHGPGLNIVLHGLDHDPERAEKILSDYVNLLNAVAKSLDKDASE